MFPPNIVAATMHQTKIELIYPGEENVSSILRGHCSQNILEKIFFIQHSPWKFLTLEHQVTDALGNVLIDAGNKDTWRFKKMQSK